MFRPKVPARLPQSEKEIHLLGGAALLTVSPALRSIRPWSPERFRLSSACTNPLHTKMCGRRFIARFGGSPHQFVGVASGRDENPGLFCSNGRTGGTTGPGYVCDFSCRDLDRWFPPDFYPVFHPAIGNRALRLADRALEPVCRKFATITWRIYRKIGKQL